MGGMMGPNDMLGMGMGMGMAGAGMIGMGFDGPGASTSPSHFPHLLRLNMQALISWDSRSAEGHINQSFPIYLPRQTGTGFKVEQ